jgi:hypothetical protein
MTSLDNRDPALEKLFDSSAPIDRAAASMEARMKWPEVPAKTAVYLLTGPNAESGREDHPFLLATVGNLRAALQRRLTDVPADAHSKRIQYGQVCTRVHWRIVHSPFAANWWYWNAARSLFPDSYKQMLGFRPTWWIAVEKHAQFPKLRRVQALDDADLQYAGPIRDKTAAGKLIETIEDVFDLCRYHHVLLQAPHGKPCAYKEMGKCPAPCDGSVPLSWYHDQMTQAFAFITGESRMAWKAATEAAMKAAAGALNFEQAGRIKQRLTRAALIEAEPFMHLAPLESFAFLSLQPGQGKPYLEPWLIHPRMEEPVRPLEQLNKKTLAAGVEALFAQCAKAAAVPVPPSLDERTTEQLGLLAHHLFRGDDDPGMYMRLTDVITAGPDAITDAAAKMFTRKSPPKPLPENASDKSLSMPNAIDCLPASSAESPPPA